MACIERAGPPPRLQGAVKGISTGHGQREILDGSVKQLSPILAQREGENFTAAMS